MLHNIPKESRAHLLHSRSLESGKGYASVENQKFSQQPPVQILLQHTTIQNRNTKANYDFFSLAIRFHNTPKPFHQMSQFIKMGLHKFSKNLAATSKF